MDAAVTQPSVNSVTSPVPNSTTIFDSGQVKVPEKPKKKKSFPCPNEKYPCSYTCMRRSGVFGRWREGGRSSSPWPKSKQPKHCLETGTCEVSKDVKSPGSIQTNILVRASIERTKNKSTRNSLILTMQGKPVGNRWQRSLLPWQPSAKQWKTILWSLFSFRLTCFSHNLVSFWVNRRPLKHSYSLSCHPYAMLSVAPHPALPNEHFPLSDSTPRCQAPTRTDSSGYHTQCC